MVDDGWLVLGFSFGDDLSLFGSALPEMVDKGGYSHNPGEEEPSQCDID